MVLSIFTGLYYLQPRNSTKLCCSRWFHEIALKYLHQTPWSTFRKTVRSGVSYYQTKNSNADTGTCLENFENYEPLQNCSFSINLAGLQIKVSDFNKNGLREKIFLWVLWNISKFARKQSVTKSFYWRNKDIIQCCTLLIQRALYIFQDTFRKCAVFKVSENFSRKMSQ